MLLETLEQELKTHDDFETWITGRTGEKITLFYKGDVFDIYPPSIFNYSWIIAMRIGTFETLQKIIKGCTKPYEMEAFLELRLSRKIKRDRNQNEDLTNFFILTPINPTLNEIENKINDLKTIAEELVN